MVARDGKPQHVNGKHSGKELQAVLNPLSAAVEAVPRQDRFHRETPIGRND